jgi:hypothetical protein
MSAEVRMRNARAAHREQVRNEVLGDTAVRFMTEDQIDAEVDRRIALVRAKGGRTAQAKRADEIELARRVLAALPALVANLDQLKELAALAEDAA